MSREDYAAKEEATYFGGFKTVRAFVDKIDCLSSLAFTSNIFSKEPGVEYVAGCARTILDRKGLGAVIPDSTISFRRVGLPVLSSVVHYEFYEYTVDEHGIQLENTLSEPLSYDEIVKELGKNTIPRHPGIAPQSGCTCGFYSFYDIPDNENSYVFIDDPAYIWAVIENTGRVIHCELGVRSEKIKILGLTTFSGLPSLIKEIPLDKYEGD